MNEGTRARGHEGTKQRNKASVGSAVASWPRALVPSLLFLAAPAFARDPASDATLERIEVVGSRIKRVDVETAQPVLVIERAELEASGQMSVGEILQDLTVHGAALNTNVNNGGDGTTRIDLRNLGERRTLVLVDGRRWIPGIDGGVDLNSIPLAMVERIEVLKDGASAIYGSDAIAGVVNITTRENLEGGAARAYVGESEYGDGRVESVEGSYGWTGERTRVGIGFSWQRQNEIFAGEREISAVPTFGLAPNDTLAGASSFTPNGLFGFGARGNCPYDPNGNYPANGRCPLPDARGAGQNRSTFDPATGGYRLFAPRNDGYNFAPENYLSTPQTRRAGFANLSHDFGASTRLTLQLFANERESAQKLAPSPVVTSILAPATTRITIPADHVYNPFGQAVTGFGLRPGGQSRDFRQDADTTRVALGLDGIYSAFGRDWFWDLDLVHSRYQIDTTTRGLLDLTLLRQALGPSFRDASGTPRCGTPAAPVAGCVPFDPFRGPDAISEDMLSYVYYAGRDYTETRSRHYRLGVSGDVIDLPAGPLALAAGLEYRRSNGESRIDPRLAALENLTGQNFGGAVRVAEAYLELAVPLLAEAKFAHALDLSLAGRHSDYDSYGRNSTFEGGLRWSPVADLMMRASFAEGFRAPIVPELFSPPFEGSFPLDFDPCAASNEPNASQRTSCLTDGVPGGVYEPAGLVAAALGGGNPDLRPETSESTSIGLVWSPSGLPGFDVAIDWFRVEIDEAISGVDGFQLLLICADAGVSEACARTTRDASGELVSVDVRDINSGLLEVEGYDLSAGYRLDSDYGIFKLRLDATHILHQRFEVPRGAGVVEGIGQLYFLEPGFRTRANLSLGWEHGAFSASTTARYYSALDEPCITPVNVDPSLCSSPDTPSPVDPEYGENRLGSRTYVDLRAGWQSPWKARFNLGVHNAIDRDPPVSYSGTSNSFDAAYPLPGRFWYVDVSWMW